MSAGDETIIRRVAERIERDAYAGPDRRAPPPTPITDYLKWLPLVAVAMSSYAGYVAMQKDVERLQQDVREIKAEAKDQHTALWRRVTE